MPKHVLLLACTMALAGTLSAAATCTPTGFFRDGINMTAAVINPSGTLTGTIDAASCNIGVYYDQGRGIVRNAQIFGANYFL